MNIREALGQTATTNKPKPATETVTKPATKGKVKLNDLAREVARGFDNAAGLLAGNFGPQLAREPISDLRDEANWLRRNDLRKTVHASEDVAREYLKASIASRKLTLMMWARNNGLSPNGHVLNSAIDSCRHYDLEG